MDDRAVGRRLACDGWAYDEFIGVGISGRRCRRLVDGFVVEVAERWLVGAGCRAARFDGGRNS